MTRLARRPTATAVHASSRMATVTATEMASRPAHQPGPGTAETALRAALTASIDAALAAEQYASAHGLSIRFGSEDLRAMALSLFIQHARDGGVR